MKLTINSIFDFATLAASKAAQEIKPFIEYVNRTTEEIVRALKNNLTFQDNFLGELKTVELVHGVESKVSIGRSSILGVLALKVASEDDALESLVTSVNQQSQLLVTPAFKLASSTKIDVTLFILY